MLAVRLEQGGIAVSPSAGVEQKSGVHLGTLQSSNGALQFGVFEERRPEPALFWADRVAPAWASDWGEDEFGVYAEFAVGNVVQRLRWIPPGRFWMGSPEGEAGRDDDEGPRHEVMLGAGFWMMDTPVRQELWQAVMRGNPSTFKSPGRPVESMDLAEVDKFIARLNKRLPGLELSLPSEAQWEYACRGGTSTATYAGNLEILGDANAPVLDGIAWYGGNSGVGFDLDNGYDSSDWSGKQYPDSPSGTHPVALKKANAFGLFDMLGNVWEWCADHWRGNYEGAPVDGSAWLSDNAPASRVVRGGSWGDHARDVRAACRLFIHPGYRYDYVGFRCVRVHASDKGSGAPIDRGDAQQAERRAAVRSMGAAEAAVTAGAGKPPAMLELPPLGRVRIVSDSEELWFGQIGRPQWASHVGCDRFGLFAEFKIDEVKQRLRWIPPGRFWMGSTDSEAGRWKNEGPRHEVILGSGFWIMDTPVRQDLWRAVMGANPSRFKSTDRPVENVDFKSVDKFIGRLNKRIPSLDLSLPSEAQWEYACRAGTALATNAGDLEILGDNNAPALDGIAWYGGNSGVGFDLDEGEDTSSWPEKQYPDSPSGTHPVGAKKANAFGLYDMLGNVGEWCADHYHESYEGAPGDGSAWLSDDATAHPRRAWRGHGTTRRGTFGRLAGTTSTPSTAMTTSAFAVSEFMSQRREGGESKRAEPLGHSLTGTAALWGASMQYRFFSIPVFESDDGEAALNAFLLAHRVLQVDRQLIQDGRNSVWAICVGYQGTANQTSKEKRGKLDYKTILSEPEFAVFSRLRGLRKELADKDGIPAYAVFTNEQLAAIVQRRADTLQAMREIEGIGDARVEKYGAAFQSVMRAAALPPSEAKVHEAVSD